MFYIRGSLEVALGTPQSQLCVNRCQWCLYDASTWRTVPHTIGVVVGMLMGTAGQYLTDALITTIILALMLGYIPELNKDHVNHHSREDPLQNVYGLGILADTVLSSGSKLGSIRSILMLLCFLVGLWPADNSILSDSSKRVRVLGCHSLTQLESYILEAGADIDKKEKIMFTWTCFRSQ